MKLTLWFRIIPIILAIILLELIIFSVTFFLAPPIYSWFTNDPSDLTKYMINTFSGLLASVVILATIGWHVATKRYHMQARTFRSIFNALARIADGDFDIDLDKNVQDLGVVGELAENVNSMALELNQLEKMRQEFISNVSHEIQSPLTSIQGFAEALQNDDLSHEKRQHFLTIIKVEATRLSRVSENLLQLASLEASQLAFSPKVYRLDKQIRDLILSCEPQWVEKSLELDVSLDDITIHADEDLLSQVWINLISNSIKFTPNGGCIHITLSQKKNTIHCKINDTGIGISEQAQAHIFERFYKVDQSRTHATNSGSGLGLSIVKKIIELHRGAIRVQSIPEQGTTFTISLPAKPYA